MEDPLSARAQEVIIRSVVDEVVVAASASAAIAYSDRATSENQSQNKVQTQAPKERTLTPRTSRRRKKRSSSASPAELRRPKRRRPSSALNAFKPSECTCTECAAFIEHGDTNTHLCMKIPRVDASSARSLNTSQFRDSILEQPIVIISGMYDRALDGAGSFFRTTCFARATATTSWTCFFRRAAIAAGISKITPSTK